MTDVFVHADASLLPASQPGCVPVHLYGKMPPQIRSASIGSPIIDELSRIRAPMNPVAFDFLSLTLAVTAADTFVSRKDSADGWIREINLVVSLSDPSPWQPVIGKLEKALNFLSGDDWRLHFTANGEAPPGYRSRMRRKLLINNCDCACLYSGGMDSAIGVLDLRAAGLNPILVSHAYPKDGSKQEHILPRLGSNLVRFGSVANPISNIGPNDVQMRTRSFNFLGMGSVLASCLAELSSNRTKLYVPENGFIAINPPLTSRRIGALSTRTTHPHYLSIVQEILDDVGIPVEIDNPFSTRTKGEMISQCADQTRLRDVAAGTVSCGKWKRKNQQCGRCVPCLIRRASFHAAGWTDETDYAQEATDLAHFLDHGNETDDLLAMLVAARTMQAGDHARWVAQTGPLPIPPSDKLARIDAVRRGMNEVRSFLIANGIS